MTNFEKAQKKRHAASREAARNALINIASVTNSAAAVIDLEKAVDPKWVKSALEEIAKATLEARRLII